MITKYKALSTQAGMTLKEYLESFHLGKSKIYTLLASKSIQMNGEVSTSDTLLKENDCISIEIEESIDYLPDKKKLDILYEDDYLLVVNKPAHILVHPDDKQKQGTMCNIVAYYYQNRGWSYQIRYAHRLDIDTTGVLLFVKDPLTLAAIDQMISTHELRRTYLCLAQGKFKEKKGTINAPIGEDRHHQQRKRISKTGKPAITHYEVIKQFKGYSLVQVELETGRTHQIRVHLASIGHPILGDSLYGGRTSEKISRVMLHSYEANFVHPITQQPLKITKPIPYDMKQLIEVKEYGKNLREKN